MIINMFRRSFCLGLAMLTLSSYGDMTLFTETWDEDDAGWVAATTEMSVQHSGFAGGTLQGTFAEQALLVSEVGAFHADADASEGVYTGDFFDEFDLNAFYGWEFDFYAADVLPSSLYVRFNDGVNTYQANVLNQLTATETWTSLATPGFEFGLSGWIGPDGETGFSNALTNVEWVEVRVERNNVGEQDYYIDNFQQAIPEPGAMALLVLGACGLFAYRRMKV